MAQETATRNPRREKAPPVEDANRVVRLPGSEPPCNVPAEQALLGSLLLNNAMFDTLSEKLRPSHFYDSLHGRVFDVIVKRLQSGRTVSPISLTPAFANDDAMGEVGGADYLVRLAAAAVSPRHAHDYAHIVYDMALRRLLIDLGGDIQAGASDSASDIAPQEQIRLAEQKLYKLGEEGVLDEGLQPFATVALEAVKRAAEKKQGDRNAVTGLSTGLQDLDRRTSGLQDSDLIILAGRTSMGKSALAMNIAFNVANESMVRARDETVDDDALLRIPAVAYFSLEMSAVQLANRILSSRTRIPVTDITRGQIREFQFRDFVTASDELSRLPLCIDDTASLDIESLCTRARRLHRQRGLKAIFVDYLQLVEGSSASRRDVREQRVAEVSRRFKGLAKELNVPVVALAQLSRQVEAREDKRPLLADLRESGSIEQDADLVFLLHREEYYMDQQTPPESDAERHEKWVAKRETVEGVATLHIAKHRNGPTGKIDLHFDRNHTRFSDLLPDDDQPPAAEIF